MFFILSFCHSPYSSPLSCSFAHFFTSAPASLILFSVRNAFFHFYIPLLLSEMESKPTLLMFSWVYTYLLVSVVVFMIREGDCFSCGFTRAAILGRVSVFLCQSTVEKIKSLWFQIEQKVIHYHMCINGRSKVKKYSNTTFFWYYLILWYFLQNMAGANGLKMLIKTNQKVINGFCFKCTFPGGY